MSSVVPASLPVPDGVEVFEMFKYCSLAVDKLADGGAVVGGA